MVETQRTTEIEVELANTPGTLADVAETLSEEGINILGFACMAQGDTGTACFVTENPEGAITVLENDGYDVEAHESLFVPAPNEPGQLATLARSLGNSGVNIEHSFVATDDSGHTVGIGFNTGDTSQAEKVLKG